MWTNNLILLLRLSLLLLSTSIIHHATAQNVGSFFTAIYINSGSQIGTNQVGCGSMGYNSYCCGSGQYCAMDGNSQIACCASGSSCSGAAGQYNNNNNNGQYTQTTTHCNCEAGTTGAAAVQVVSTANANCANKCGYYGQLCCAANQYCITDSNNQAQCAASPQGQPTTVVGVVYATPATVTTTQNNYVSATTQATNGLVVVTTTAATAAAQAGSCAGGYTTSVLTEKGAGLPVTQTQGCTILEIVSAASSLQKMGRVIYTVLGCIGVLAFL